MDIPMSDRYPCGICQYCGRTLYAFQFFGNEMKIECPCVTAEREEREKADAELRRRNRIKVRLAQSGLPPKMQGMTFDAFERRKGTEKALDACRAFADSFGASDRGILLAGQPGSGKTHLACATVVAVIERGYRAKFIRCADITYLLRETYNSTDRSEGEVVEPLRSAPLLVIDDIGVQRMTDYDKSVIHGLIDHRINYGRPTIYTTNLNASEMERVLQPQTVDRIFSPANTEIIKCNATSYRRRRNDD